MAYLRRSFGTTSKHEKFYLADWQHQWIQRAAVFACYSDLLPLSGALEVKVESLDLGGHSHSLLFLVISAADIELVSDAAAAQAAPLLIQAGHALVPLSLLHIVHGYFVKALALLRKHASANDKDILFLIIGQTWATSAEHRPC